MISLGRENLLFQLQNFDKHFGEQNLVTTSHSFQLPKKNIDNSLLREKK